PDGEDPDSFARNKTTEELKKYLEEHAQDFIQFKTSLLLDAAKNDPIKKAALIRDIVASISKIPNNIQKEIYVQECAQIMGVSEKVLFDELSQNLKKEQREASKKQSSPRTPFTGVVKETKQVENVDRLMVLESALIWVLLIYGDFEVDFVDYISEIDEKGEKIIKKENYTNTVCNEIYVNLQEDEIKFTNPIFIKIYYEIINRLNQEQVIDVKSLTKHDDIEIATMVTNILMDEEQYVLSDWERHDIIPKSKERGLPKFVPDVIYNLRMYLVKELILSTKKNMGELSQNESSIQSSRELLDEIKDYIGLQKILAEKLNRVI
ncbi:MAG: DNA primase, partial [Flavobacteriaceae bacterium]|nr:DNA primase [Flavobacteriaceae bacterium]